MALPSTNTYQCICITNIRGWYSDIFCIKKIIYRHFYFIFALPKYILFLNQSSKCLKWWQKWTQHHQKPLNWHAEAHYNMFYSKSRIMTILMTGILLKYELLFINCSSEWLKWCQKWTQHHQKTLKLTCWSPL